MLGEGFKVKVEEAEEVLSDLSERECTYDVI